MKKIAIIPARAGSKGLPNKNILMLGDKPLMAHTIEAAIDSGEFHRIIVSTDSLEYKTIAERYGAEVMIRGAEISGDNASSFVVIEDVLKRLNEEIDYFVLLQVTSPFRTAEHIKESNKLFEKNYDKFDFLVSMQRSAKSAHLIVPIDEDNSLKGYTMDYSNYARQKYKEFYPNGGIFTGKVDKYLERKHFYGAKSLAYFMDKEDSVDIDDPLDFEFSIMILNRKHKAEILLNNIKNRITQKEKEFLKKSNITLIGNSLFDYWNIENFKNKSVANLGVAGISTLEYQDLILDKNRIKNLGDTVFIMTGTNDIIDKSLSFENIAENINKMISSLYNIKKDIKIYFFEIPSVAFRMDRKKEEIFELNKVIKENLDKSVSFIEINKDMTDEFGNLKLDYTNDGLHFNQEGYKQFEKILEREIEL